MSLNGKPTLSSSAPFTNDGFWPDLSYGDLLTRYRVPSDFPDAVVPTALQLAVIRVNEDLEAVKEAIILLSYNSLADYASDNSKKLAGEETLILRYEHAAYSRAKAGLIPQFINSVSRPKGDGASLDEADQTEQYWLDESQRVVTLLHREFLPASDGLPGNANNHVALL